MPITQVDVPGSILRGMEGRNYLAQMRDAQQQRQKGNALQGLFAERYGGRDPNTGIDWNTGRQGPGAVSDQEFVGRAMAIDPQTGMSLQKHMAGLRKDQIETATAEAPLIAGALRGVSDQTGWDRAKNMLGRAGVDTSDMPSMYSPELHRQTLEVAQHLMGEGGDDPGFTLSPGQTRYDASGKPVASAPAAPQKDTALEAKIGEIMRSFGVDRRTASGIATGVVGIVTDPVSGQHVIYDKVTGQGRLLDIQLDQPGAAPPQPGAAPPAPAQPAPTLYDLSETGDVAGLAPATREVLSETVGQIPGVPVADETIEARQAFRTAQNDLIRSLSINPRFPVAEMERIRSEISIEPRVFDSTQALQARMRSLDQSLRRRLRNETNAANNPRLPVETRQAASQAANDIRNFLNIMGVPQGGDGSSSLSPEDEALIQKYTK